MNEGEKVAKMGREKRRGQKKGGGSRGVSLVLKVYLMDSFRRFLRQVSKFLLFAWQNNG